MTKKRGFTLVEILVVLAITTLVLAMVGGLLIFMADTSGKLIHKSEELMLVQSIETYLRGVLVLKQDNEVIEPKSIEVAKTERNNSIEFTLKVYYYENDPNSNQVVIIFDSQGNICNSDEKVLFKDTGLETFDIYYANADGERDDGGPFVHCELVFTPTGGSTPGSHTYDFIIGIKKQDN